MKIKLLQDTLENRFCDFAKEDCILALISSFALTEKI